MANLPVVGLQWGDEGKGKIVDYLAGDFDAVARYNGGSNAGHTVVIGKRKHTFHLIPSGALKKKELLIGAGVVLDPVVLGEELRLLPDSSRRRMLVDGKCTLVTPFERELDSLLEKMRGSAAIGTTRRGIGPAYAMRAFRLAPRLWDLLGGFDFGPLERFSAAAGVRTAGMSSWLRSSRSLLSGLAGDVSSRITSVCERSGSVLFEGSQGTLLDLLHGSYPYVTSTHTTASYIPAALGIRPSLVGDPIGVAKCYCTRVGRGPFPTELGGALGESVRSLGNEYGSTTGRPRRVGWLDLVSMKYSLALNGARKVAITKLDVLARVKSLKVCSAYSDDGTESTDFARSIPRLSHVRPVYDSLEPLQGADFSHGLPKRASRFLEYLEHELKVDVALASYGEERTRTAELSPRSELPG